MKLINSLLLIMFFVIFSCKGNKNNVPKNRYNIKLTDWKIKTKNGVTDTLNVKSWIPNSELSMVFSKNNDTICQKPNLEFYPIELENYIEKKLMNYLLVRSTLFPPPPKIYTTEKHIVLGWNFEKLNFIESCDLSELEQKIQRKLNLKRKFNPVDIDLKKGK